MFSLKDKESADEFMHPPKPVVPARYLYVTDKPTGESANLDVSKFPGVTLTPNNYFAATWVVKGISLASQNFTICRG